MPDWTRDIVGLGIASDDISFTLNEYTSSLTLSEDNYLVIIDASTGNITVTLPASASHTNRIYTIKKIDSSGNSVTIDANGTEKIDGEKTVVLNLQFAYITIVCDGDEWFIIGGEYVKIDELLRQILSEIKDISESVKETEKEIKEIGHL